MAVAVCEDKEVTRQVKRALYTTFLLSSLLAASFYSRAALRREGGGPPPSTVTRFNNRWAPLPFSHRANESKCRYVAVESGGGALLSVCVRVTHVLPSCFAVGRDVPGGDVTKVRCH